jgi:hypothetical protein
MSFGASYAGTVQPVQKELWVSAYGAKGNGSTDDTAAIQGCLNAATAGTVVRFPSGTFMVSQTLNYPGNIVIVGAGDSDGGTTIKAIAGSAIATPILASLDWHQQNTFAGSPVSIRDLKIDGNVSNTGTSGTGGHGILVMNYWTTIERCTVVNCSGDGIQQTAINQGSTHISNTSNEFKVIRVQFRNNSGNGLRVYDTGSACTDGFLEGCIFDTNGLMAVSIDSGAGWFLYGNHVYYTSQDAISISKCYAARVIGNYIDQYASGSNTYVAGIRMNCIDGRASVCANNHVGFESGSATGPYQGIVIQGAGSATSVCVVTGNTVNGGSQSGSLGYVIQTSAGQQGHPWIVYFHGNDARNVATYSYVDQYVTGGDLLALNHITSSAPVTLTAAAGTNAGTSPPAPVKNSCTDVDGQITFGTGTSPAAGIMVSVTFAQTYAHAPSITVSPINSASASLNLYVQSTTSGFTLRCVNAPSASQGNTVYGFNYHVMA